MQGTEGISSAGSNCRSGPFLQIRGYLKNTKYLEDEIVSEIRTLNLFRCGSAEDSFENTGEEAAVNYFVTDYFDSIMVEKQDQKAATLSECMGILKEANTKKGVSHQRFCLYSSEDTKCDIFGRMDNFPVLMVIQLFVNPNIYQASSFDGGEKLSRKKLIGKLQHFVETHYSASEVIWEIYELLTAGDFAVVIRCEKIHKAYDICTLIRSLRLSVKEGGCADKVGESVFFSYSICGVMDGIDEKEPKKRETLWGKYLESEDQVVVRIKYTQSFRQRLTKDARLKKKLLTEGFHLIGRYDHQMSLSPAEFQQIYPLLRQYKLEGRGITPDDLTETPVSGKVRILVAMMAGCYIAQINERLLLKYDEDAYLEGTRSDEWTLVCDNGMPWRTLHKENNRKIEEIKKKVLVLEKATEPYYQSARNLKEYLRLLGRLCRVLREINKLKELRISVANALIQYETLIDSFQYYIDRIPEGKEKVYADIIETNLQYGLRALEIFTRYIRNVNLQAFQTPNYDLQTNMSIEKVLLAYSQFLKPYVIKKEKTSPYIISVDLQPLIVPSMGVRDLSVTVPFDSSSSRDDEASPRRLMIVYSPTFSFLCETCFQLSAVFHEIAHQFRYENRRERNQCLERSVLKKFIHLLIVEILNGYNSHDLAGSPVVEDMVEMIYRDVFSCLIQEEDREERLFRFVDILCRELTEFCGYAFQTGQTARSEVERYLSKTRKGIQEYDQLAVEAISRIADCLDQIDEVDDKMLRKKCQCRNEILRERVCLQARLAEAVQEFKACQEDQIFGSIIKNLKEAEECDLADTCESLWRKMSHEHDNSEEIGREAFKKWNDWEDFARNTNAKNTKVDMEQIRHLLKQYHNINEAYREFRRYIKGYDWSEEDFEQRYRYWELFEALCGSLQEGLQKALNELLKSHSGKMDWEILAVPSEYIDDLMKSMRLKGEKGMQKAVREWLQFYCRDDINIFVQQEVLIYRETTSDLFMCASMNLDFFGYLVVAAEMLKFDRQNKDMQMKRVSCVLQCLYVRESGNRDESGKLSLTAQDFYRGLKKRMEKETELLLRGLHKVLKGRDEGADFLDKWPEEHKFGNLKEMNNFLDECVLIGNLTSTQRWILRIYRQVVAIVRCQSEYEMNQDIIGQKEIWYDITSEQSYYFNEDVRKILKTNGDSGLCSSITEILNSPARFFAERKAILQEEMDFILSQYERNCKSIFIEQGGGKHGV